MGFVRIVVYVAFVPVAITLPISIKVIEHKAFDRNAAVVEAFNRLIQLADRMLAGPCHDQCGSRMATDDGRVGYRQDWRGIDDDGIEQAAELG